MTWRKHQSCNSSSKRPKIGKSKVSFKKESLLLAKHEGRKPITGKAKGESSSRRKLGRTEIPAKMVPGRRALSWAALALVLLLVCLSPGVSRGNKLKLMLQRREAPVPVKADVSVKEDKAKEFLSSLKRQKRQLWDRSQPDVQQWYQQFLYLGFDEAKFEDDVSYWSNLGRSGHEYYGGYYHHHYDEDAPIGPRNPHTFRHGASVNYDDY
ncbi:augurin isoform X2 [Podarcis raffonei]|uniref:augurin isoform X2 n=1 Tax=Podarcis raffonei TaxID=65483 RepID=UPI00232997CD|nr:augurin isoform X2 [Podarcis raffonei]